MQNVLYICRWYNNWACWFALYLSLIPLAHTNAEEFQREDLVPLRRGCLFWIHPCTHTSRELHIIRWIAVRNWFSRIPNPGHYECWYTNKPRDYATFQGWLSPKPIWFSTNPQEYNMVHASMTTILIVASQWMCIAHAIRIKATWPERLDINIGITIICFIILVFPIFYDTLISYILRQFSGLRNHIMVKSLDQFVGMISLYFFSSIWP